MFALLLGLAILVGGPLDVCGQTVEQSADSFWLRAVATSPRLEQRDPEEDGQKARTASELPPAELVSPGLEDARGGINDLQISGASDPDGAAALALSDVIASLYRSYPVIEQARLGRNVARGEILSARGAYDLQLQAYTLSEPTGFYRNYRNGLGVARQTWWGGYLSAGYRIGRGQFEPWYKERETNEGGEFQLGMGFPLLQGKAIDAERVAFFQANLANRAAEPQIQAALLAAGREAAEVYWEWVAAGARLVAQRELLGLAKDRQQQFEAGAEAGKFAEIDVVFNRQLVAERQSGELQTQQKFREAGFKLSLYLRDEVGQAMAPDDDWLPLHFPIIEELPSADFNADFAAALTRRPEIMSLNIEAQQIQLDQRLATNQILPTLDLLAEASQDVGPPASSINDKGQFELLVGVQGELPLQRRKALGKIQTTSAKLSQIQQKLRLQRDKIAIELQTADNALSIAEQVVEQAEISLRAAFETLQRYRFAYQRGYADLIYLNWLESKANETEIKLVDAQRDWFIALARMQTALGLDPLEQAINVSELPLSGRPGPGGMPEDLNTVPDSFDADWQKHSRPPDGN